MPVDYYTVFSELEAQLADKFDFINEAQAKAHRRHPRQVHEW